MASFYKSYSGIGAYLGVFLSSKEVKVNTNGLISMGFHKHLKLEYVITDSPEEIIKFYGLDFEKYKQGFETRSELF